MQDGIQRDFFFLLALEWGRLFSTEPIGDMGQKNNNKRGGEKKDTTYLRILR